LKPTEQFTEFLFSLFIRFANPDGAAGLTVQGRLDVLDIGSESLDVWDRDRAVVFRHQPPADLGSVTVPCDHTIDVAKPSGTELFESVLEFPALPSGRIYH
jgi:hypothetical protein